MTRTPNRAARSLDQFRPTSWPEFDSPAWHALAPDDPRKYAAVCELAIRWQRHVAEQARVEQLMVDDPAAWYAETFMDARKAAARLVPAMRAMRTAKEMKDARAKPGPVHQLKATPGWPDVAIPGQPGKYLKPDDQEQVA